MIKINFFSIMSSEINLDNSSNSLYSLNLLFTSLFNEDKLESEIGAKYIIEY